MVRDRMSEFQRRVQSTESFDQHDSSSHLSSFNNPVSDAVAEINVSRLAYDTATRSQRFLQHVDELRQSIETLSERILTLREKQSNVLSQTIVKPEEKEQLESLIEEVKRLTKALRPRVRQIEEDLQRDEADAPAEFKTGAELRIRRNHCEALKHRLNDLLMVFNQAQVEYKQRVSRRVKRQLDLAGEHLSGQEVDEMLESKSQEVFYRQINPLSFAAQMALEDATSRHNEILKLEQSIGELNEVFRDMYELVHSQSEVVDRIASNVEAATEFTRDARVQVTKAVKYKTSAQRKKMICTLIAMGILFIVLVLIIIYIITFISNTVKR
ncbi:syntaxin domain-containing protein [Ditylenchus destructor]|uniref:Syntaxin domain-containing protein n=1 Tax=Ditylenchus destructor TaxID=166010 RepID=A0AAD4MV15_9BILA|nr:syntaxin domain-containing protein [Ditylenchus destructor]